VSKIEESLLGSIFNEGTNANEPIPAIDTLLLARLSHSLII